VACGTQFGYPRRGCQPTSKPTGGTGGDGSVDGRAPSAAAESSYGLTTEALGPCYAIDVTNDDTYTPVLVPAADFTGQMWHVEPLFGGAFRLSPASASGTASPSAHLRQRRVSVGCGAGVPLAASSISRVWR
jgi:hypothetical protein